MHTIKQNRKVCLKALILYYMDGMILYNRAQYSIPRAIAHIKDLSYLSDYNIMRLECLNRRGHKRENKFIFILKLHKYFEKFRAHLGKNIFVLKINNIIFMYLSLFIFPSFFFVSFQN